MSDRICSVEGCQGQNHARGFCDRHYRRFRRCGTTDFRTREEYFWIKVDKRGPDECWPWTGFLRPDGYGMFWIGGRVTSSSRAAYELLVGPIPDGLLVRHSCDNRKCVNPAHLSVGTQADNSADKVERERQSRGTGNGKAVHTEEEVRLVRAALALGHSELSIAKCADFRRQFVWNIAHAQAWSHVK